MTKLRFKASKLVIMELKLQSLSNIDKSRQITVYGYIHEYEKVNDVNIPKGIILVLILFYGNDKDEWDPKHISEYMTLSDKTITQKKYDYASSYGKRIIDSGVFKWRLKVNECNNYGFLLGIRRVEDKETYPPTDTWFTEGGFQNGYGFYSHEPILTSSDGFALGEKYGIKPSNGSIIEMILDLDDLTLSYIIDGKDYGKAFDVAKGKYRLGVCMREVPDSLTLL